MFEDSDEPNIKKLILIECLSHSVLIAYLEASHKPKEEERMRFDALELIKQILEGNHTLQDIASFYDLYQL